MVRCPGPDQRFWKPEDIFEVMCPRCGQHREFFEDEPQLKCRKCGHVAINPSIDRGCAEWCQYAEQCLDAPAHILKIIASHHRAKDIDTLESQVIWDADCLINLQDACSALSSEQWTQRINKIFKTTMGRQLGLETFVPVAGSKSCRGEANE